MSTCCLKKAYRKILNNYEDMEDPKRPPEEMVGPGTRSGPWISPDYLVQGAKFFKNHKMKNTAGMVI